MKWLLLLLLLPATLWAETLDVVIIGSGMSGTYTGWRLIENGKKDVHIFEGNDRIGGRLHTTFLPGMPNVPVELGGMRFFPSQKKIFGLIKHLQLATMPFTKEGQNNLIYVRGKRFHEKDENKDLPYDLPSDEKKKDPYALILTALNKIDPSLSVDNWHAKKDTVRYKGQSLYDVSFQTFILEVLSPEAFQLLSDLGYMQMVADTSIATTLSTFINGASGEPLKLTKGFDGVPKELAKRFEAKGGQVHLKHHLMSVSYEGDKEDFRYRLLFYRTDGSFKPVFAKHLIFTITPPALQLLAQQSPALKNEGFQANLEQLIPNPLTKLYLGYDHPWWQKLGLHSGSSVTTLPIRNCYYFESEEEMPGGEAGNRKSLILASFQNLYTPFWDSFSDGKEFAPGLGENATWQAEKQLEILHGIHNMPKAYTGAFVDWTEAPNFGAYFFWRTGSKPEELAQYFQHPFVGEPLYVIGSAFSQQQGWVEGALESADSLLQSYFFIKPPKF